MMVGQVTRVATRRYLQQLAAISTLQLVQVTGSKPERGLSNGTVAPTLLGHSGYQQRHYSSSNYSPDFLCSNQARIFVRDLEVNTKDFRRTVCPPKSESLDSLIGEALAAANDNFNIDVLKELYSRMVRPELVSRMLIHKYPLDHSFTHWLKYQTHGITGETPSFTTCYDVMMHLVGLHKDDWVFYLNYLAQERIAVIEEWVSVSFTQRLIYNHGLKDFGGVHFFKGESDASWHQSSKTANLSGIIWDDQQVVSAKTYLDVPDCYSITQSEAKAALAILTEAKDLGIENFALWSDSKPVCGVLSGTKHIKSGDKDWQLFMALRSLRPAFKRLVVVRVPREMVHFADGMLREPGVKLLKTADVKYPRLVKQSAKKWAYHLNGLPIFRLAMTPEAIGVINNFGKEKPIDGEPLAIKFYVEVELNKKISALHNVISVLNPAKVYVAIDNIESKADDILKDLYDLVGNTVAIKTAVTWSVLCTESTRENPKGTVLIVFDGWCVELEKDLPRADLTVALCAPEDIPTLSSMGVRELSASAFFFYHGPCLPTDPSKDKGI